jgi:predicted small lipoprotein YifL
MNKKIISLLLAVVMVLSLAACGNKPVETTTPPTEAPTQAPTQAPETLPNVTVENPVSYFSLSMSQTAEEYNYMTAYPNEDGTVYVEYQAEERKVGILDGVVLHILAEELAKTGLADLNGKDAYEEGEASCSMFIELADGTMLTVGFSGTIPEEFVTGYNAMLDCFKTITASVPVYVPQAQVMGEVNADLLAAIQEIVNNSGMQNLDTMAISEIVKDEYFTMTLGLTSDEGIAAGANCAAMMMTTPYALNVVLLEDASKADAVAADFEANLGWRNWVCVAPTDALIATKDNMVLSLLGSDALFTQTKTSIENAGWTIVNTLTNPDM